MKLAKSPWFQFGICTVSYLYITSSPSVAQITSDGTVNTQVNQNGNVSEITQGETRGSNLFHSFQDFSVTTGNEAFFNNANDISNIFSRVTGGNISNIDGLIRANGSASLFLINPAGIVFGEGASLDIGGSFYGSSASSILFEDGEFSAADLDNPPLLTVNAPIGLSFRDNPGDIVNRSDFAERTVFEAERLTLEAETRISEAFENNEEFVNEIGRRIELDGFTTGDDFNQVALDFGIISQEDIVNETFENIDRIGLEIDSGKNFALLGGNVSIENSAIIAPGGKVTLGGLAEVGTIAIEEDGVFTFPENVVKADVLIQDNVVSESTTLSSRAKIDVVSNNGGNIAIIAGELILDNANLKFGLNEEASIDSIAGDIILDADTISLTNSEIASNAFLVNEGIVGNITLSADVISLNERSTILLSSSDNGQAGNISLTADSIFSKSQQEPDGFGTFRSFITNASSNGGITGNINLIANNISLNSTDIQTSAGLIFVDFDPSETTNGIVRDINLNANSIDLDDTTISLTPIESSDELVPGNRVGGDVNISTGSLSLSNNSAINIFSAADEGIRLGDINLDTKSISIDRGSQISTQTFLSIDASDINIKATDFIGINNINSGIVSQTGNLGNSGNISIDTSKLEVADGGQISANNFIVETFDITPGQRIIRNILEQPIEGSGDAGTIYVAANSIALEGGGGIVALSSAGEGGNINLRVDDILSLKNNSEISATAGELNTPGNGGNINIDSQFIVAFPQGNNNITANAFDGAGGNISIAAEGIFGIQERPNSPLTNDITASSQAGVSGSISIATPDLNPVQGATELPNNLVEVEQSTEQVCRPSQGSATRNVLNITGKGGVVPSPTLPLNSLNVTVEGKNDLTANIPAPIVTSIGKIQPARGIRVNESGMVSLTAYRTNSSGERLKSDFVNCDRM